MSKFVLAMLLVLSYSFTAEARPNKGMPAVHEDRILYISGVITSSTLAPVQKALENWSTSGDRRDITLVISSPGGEVTSGTRFINQMKQAQSVGIEFNCYVLDMAASMAFQILTHCDTRHSMDTSYLLWHGVRVGLMFAIVTQEVAQAMYLDLRRFNDTITAQLRSALSLPDRDIRKHFLAETLWSGKQLADADPGFITARRAYPEIHKKLGSAVKSATRGGMFGPGDYIYIWRRYMPVMAEDNK